MSVPPFIAQDPRDDAKTVEGEVVDLVRPGGFVEIKTDQMRAIELKTQASEALIPFLRLMDQAARDGFLIRWATIQPNSYGRHEVVDLHLLKRF